MKKIIYAFCAFSFYACAGIASNSNREDFFEGQENNSNRRITVEHEDGQFKGDWTETFDLTNGLTITHTPVSVSVDGFMSEGSRIIIKIRFDNNMSTSRHELNLITNSRREEFIQALIESGLYKDYVSQSHGMTREALPDPGQPLS